VTSNLVCLNDELILIIRVVYLCHGVRLSVGNKHIIAMMMVILKRLLTPSLQMHHIISRGLKVHQCTFYSLLYHPDKITLKHLKIGTITSTSACQLMFLHPPPPLTRNYSLVFVSSFVTPSTSLMFPPCLSCICFSGVCNRFG
jgi:hypothetical protein